MGVAAVESTTTGAGCAAAAARSGIVSNGFDGASSQTSCTPSGGTPVWSNSTKFRPHLARTSNRRPVPKYAPSASAITAPGSRSARARPAAGWRGARAYPRRRACSRGEQQRVTAVELAERPLRRDAGGVRVALVVEVARLAALVVRPDRRAVERGHGASLARWA